MAKLLLRTISIYLFVTQIYGENLTEPNVPSPSSLLSSSPSTTTIRSLHLNNTIDVNLNGTLRLENVLEVFNIRTVSSKWDHISEQITPKCSNEMALYLNGLKNQRPWAVKSKFEIQKKKTERNI